MAHAYKKTLLAKLGFADEDRKNPKHDLACRYVSRATVAAKLIGSIRGIGREWGEKPKSRRIVGSHTESFPQWDDWRLTHVLTPRFEFALSKGQGQYKTTVGFLDVVLQAVTETVWNSNGERYESDHIRREAATVLVEVKAGPVLASEILKQINLYREHLEDGPYRKAPWALVCCYPIGAGDMSVLMSQGIRVFKLGDDFERWCATYRAESEVPGTPEEL